MGRTVTPFSMDLAEQQKRLGHFRRSLRKQDQELFDELFERARPQAQAAMGEAANHEPMESMFISALPRAGSEGLSFDTPTALSGGILASLRTACRGRSYTRSTSV